MISQAVLKLSQRHEILMSSDHSTGTCSHNKAEIIVPVKLICECAILLRDEESDSRSPLVPGLIRSRKVLRQENAEVLFSKKIFWEIRLYIALTPYVRHVFIKHNSSLLHQQTIYTLYSSAVYISLHVSA